MARYRAARLPEDEDLLERAHAVADELVSTDPGLTAPEHVLLGRAVEEIRTARIAA